MYDDEKGSFDDTPVIDGDHEPVTRAKKNWNGEIPDAIRPFADISAREWARYQRAKSITDPAKLAALVPACNRPWTFPRSHGPRAEFTFAELRHVPGAPPKLPNMLTRRGAEVLRMPKNPYLLETTKAYVLAFDRANNLISA